MKRLSQKKIVLFFGIGYRIGLETKRVSDIDAHQQLPSRIARMSNSLVMFGV